MCGIVGVFTTAGAPEDSLVSTCRTMADTLRHRGPDDHGVWTDAAYGIGLGFRRLSILDLSALGHQPMHSPSGRYVLAFNGEVYNHRALRLQLEQSGTAFRGHSDSEVLAATIDHWGIRGSIARLVGMFALAIWDRQARRLTLVRDRLGEKPLYYCSSKGTLTFGSELKALMALPGFDRSLDGSAIASYLRYLYVPTPRSIFKGVYKLPAGHLLTLDRPDAPLPAALPYWDLDEVARLRVENPFTGSDEEAVDELEAILHRAVRLEMEADVPLGALLSGGVDSSTIAALMQGSSSSSIRTFSIGFEEEKHNEAPHAARIAAHLGTDHTELVLTANDALRTVPELPLIFDEPFADPSQIPTLLVCRLARQSVTVALSGDGGDELFGGYNRYIETERWMQRLDRVPRLIRRTAAAAVLAVPEAFWEGGYDLARSFIPHTLQHRLPGRKITKLARLARASSPEEVYRSLMSVSANPHVYLCGAHGGEGSGLIPLRAPGTSFLTRAMLTDQRTYLPDDLLAKVDRASMAVSLELRVPLLDHRVVEFSWRLPGTMKIRGREGKWILRRLLHRYVPPELVDRPKVGFTVPIEAWLRGQLAPWAEEMLLSRRPDLEDIILRDEVARMWRAFNRGYHDLALALWAILMLYAWHDHWCP